MENEVCIKTEKTINNDKDACIIPSQDGSSVGDKVKFKEEISLSNESLLETRNTKQNVSNKVPNTEMDLKVPNLNITIKNEYCDNSERKEKFETIMVKEEPRFFEESSINIETNHNDIKIEPIEENTLKSESVIIPCDPFNSSIVLPEGNIKNYAPKSVPNSAPNYKFKCTKCDAKFSDPQAMIVHRIIHGEPNPKIKCTKCEKFFVKNSAMKKHYRLSHVKLQCTYCNYWTDKKRNLNKHIEIAHTCKKCSMKCNMQNHSCRMKIKSFKCTICQEKFSDEVAMTNHIQSHVKLTNVDAVS